MPSPSAFSKFGLSILNFFKHAQFFMYTQNHFGILKSKILLHKLAHLSTPKMFWVQPRNLSIPKNLRTLKTNFEKADGLGISERQISWDISSNCVAFLKPWNPFTLWTSKVFTKTSDPCMTFSGLTLMPLVRDSTMLVLIDFCSV